MHMKFLTTAALSALFASATALPNEVHERRQFWWPTCSTRTRTVTQTSVRTTTATVSAISTVTESAVTTKTEKETVTVQVSVVSVVTVTNVSTVTETKAGDCDTSNVDTTTPADPVTTPPPTEPTFGELCPHYCVITTQLPHPSPHLCPIWSCGSKDVTVTKTNQCTWCPTMSCGSIRTSTLPYQCPDSCPRTRTATVTCPYSTRPSGYSFTIG